MAPRFTRSLLAAIITLVLVACGGAAPTPGGGLPTISLSDLAGTYNGEFQVNDEGSDEVFINGLTTFTVSGNAISGTLTADDDFDFPNDTGTVSGTLTATSDYGFFDAALTFDFATAPDYTAEGRVVYAEASRGIAGNLTLKRDGAFVGGVIISGTKE